MEENEQQSKVNFIPCIKWVKKGAAKCNPEKVGICSNNLKAVRN